jgi:hypothetical protein
VAIADATHLHVERVAQWRAWFRRHHASESGVWAITWRAGAAQPAPTYEEWVEEARRRETRARRVLETAEKAQRNERADEWRPPPAGPGARGRG